MARTTHRYSEAVKQGVVAEIEQGQLSLREAAQQVHTSVTQIQQWVVEYGRYKPKRDVVEVVMKSEQDKIAALEKALADAHLQVRVYEALIAQANRHFKTDLKKNFGPSRPSASVPTPGRPSTPSAGSSDGAATRTTNAAPGAAPARRSRK
jgi:transposase-like protein